MSLLLGVDGGGTKTDFLLIDATGEVRARYRAGSAYYPETGLAALGEMLASGIAATLRLANVTAADVHAAFIGLPAHGEDSALEPQLEALPAQALPHGRYRCGNDMVCGRAGALAGEDGINLVAGTGSIAYGEYAGRQARAGGWGELFSDEGSAYWVAREALNRFARMSDGRLPRGPLYALVRERFALQGDLDLCAAVYGPPALSRSGLAALAPLVARAAAAGDLVAQEVLVCAAQELAGLVGAVREALQPAAGVTLPVSCTGGMFQFGELILEPLRRALRTRAPGTAFVAPRMAPDAGAALCAARFGGVVLGAAALARLADQCPPGPSTAGGA